MEDGPLITAVKASNHADARALLEAGHDVHERGEQDWPALNFAAGRGDRAMVQLLLTHGANVFLTGRDRRTPYQIALAASHREVVRDLRDREETVGGDRDRVSSREQETRPYCKAYHAAALRPHARWRDAIAPIQPPIADGDIVFLQADYSVTRSFWPDRDTLFTDDSAEWREFCHSSLSFHVPRDLDEP